MRATAIWVVVSPFIVIISLVGLIQYALNEFAAVANA
jgi:hypothetical protein